MIKVTLGAEAPQTEKPFPKLMKSNDTGRIVFFIRQYIGVQINYLTSPNDNNKSPHFFDEWNMDCFTDYNEPITIQNA